MKNLKIQLKISQLQLLKNWLPKQEYLTIDEVEIFKNSFRDYGVELKEVDFDMIFECCPFGFIISAIEEYDLLCNGMKEESKQ